MATVSISVHFNIHPQYRSGNRSTLNIHTHTHIYTKQPSYESIERDPSFPRISFFPFLSILVFFTLPLSIASLPSPGKSVLLDREKRRVHRISMSLCEEEEEEEPPPRDAFCTKKDGYIVVRGCGGVNKPEGRHRINRACLKSSVKFRRLPSPPPLGF